MPGKYYCSLPFRGMQIDTNGTLQPCCLYDTRRGYKDYSVYQIDEWWNNYANELRQKVLNDELDPGCATCFGSEAVEHRLRPMSNKFFNYTTKTSATPESLVIRFGNICNLKCLMCHPDCSSQIEQENKKFKIYPVTTKRSNFNLNKSGENWWEDQEQLEKIIKIIDRARVVDFAGGEPLIIPALNTILENISTNVHVSITTNLTRLSERTLELCKKFKNIRIQVSLDGVGKHHEYIRWGSCWEDIDQNIQRIIKTENIQLTFNCLLQHTSVFTWPSLWKYLEPYNRLIVVTAVYSKSLGGIINSDSVSPMDMENFVNWHRENSTPYDEIINQWINSYKFDLKKHINYKKYIEKLDAIRGRDYDSTFNPNWITRKFTPRLANPYDEIINH